MSAPVSKKFINSAADVVAEQLEGAALCDPDRITCLKDVNVLIRSDVDLVKLRQVTVITGGGSGHEPAFGGYVGTGFMTAAVCGGVFASPATQAVLAAIRASCGPAGCLVVVMNYTGDRLNFGKAVEQAKAEGLRVSMLIVGDDCALPRIKGITGRRGVAGTILVQKVACAAAEAGLPLEEVLAEATRAAEAVGTMGVALTVCSLPGQPVNTRLDARTIEVGLGIHGEPGVNRQPLAPADQLADTMVEGIVGGKGGEAAYLPLQQGEEVAVMINNLGGTTKMEEAVVARAALAAVRRRGGAVRRMYCGHFMTALDMCGVSLTIMRVDPLLLARLDASCCVPAWHGGAKLPAQPPTAAAIAQPQAAPAAGQAASTAAAAKVPPGPAAAVDAAITAAAKALIAAEPQLTEWDAKTGDGDCGATFERGARALQAALPGLPHDDMAGLLCGIASVAGGAMGGTSGAIVDIFFTAGAGAAAQGWPAVVTAGADAVSFYGGAKAGMRTLLDALVPFSQEFTQHAAAGKPALDAFAAAVPAARSGAESTRGMQAQAGRANYVQGGAALENVPDPGAMAVAAALDAVLEALKTTT